MFSYKMRFAIHMEMSFESHGQTRDKTMAEALSTDLVLLTEELWVI